MNPLILRALMAAAKRRGAGGGGIKYVGGYVAGFAGSSSDISIPLTSLTGGLASAPAEDDLVVIGVASARSADLDLVVTGYTKIADLYVNDDYDTNLGVFYKFMGAPPDTTATWVGGTGDSIRAGTAYVSVWRGVDLNTPMDVAATTATGGNSVLADPPSITPITPGAVIVAIGAGGHDDNVTTYSSSDLAAFLSAVGDNLKDSTIGGGYKKWRGGAFDPAAFIYSGSTSIYTSWAAVTLALRPA